MTSGSDSYTVHAVLIGKVTNLEDGKGHSVMSGINKTPVTNPVFLSTTHFEGDEQADLKNHGGLDKAILGYSLDHYPYWEEKLGKSIDYGAFGENLTFSGLAESTIHIGDVYQLDETVIQVSQPRQPCFKLAFKHRVKEMPLWVEETGRAGIYFRVLKEGEVTPNPKFSLIKKGKGSLTLEQINQIVYSQTPAIEDIKAIAELEGLAPSFKRQLEKMIEKQDRR